MSLHGKHMKAAKKILKKVLGVSARVGAAGLGRRVYGGFLNKNLKKK